MTGIDHELATLAQQGDLASFCPRCHAAAQRLRRARPGASGWASTWRSATSPATSSSTRGSRSSSASARPCWTGDAVATDVLCPHCHASLVEAESALRRVRVARVHHRRLAAHARGAALVLHARGLPLARRAQEDARQDPRRGAAAEEAGAGPEAPRPQLPGGQLRLRQRAGRGRGEPLPAVQEAHVRRRLPRGRRHPRVRRPGGRGRLRRRGPADPREERAAGDLRARVPAGRPVREGVPAGQQGRAARRRRARAVRRRLRARDRPGHVCRRGPRRRAAASPWSAAGRRA